jgi:predicted acetyltransferase
VRAALWEYLIGVDLVETVTATNIPVDDPIRQWVADFRRVRVDFMHDGLWLAPLDPRALLAARRYSVFDGHLVIEVVDPSGRATTFAVDGNRDGAQCGPTDDAPDLVCSAQVLGACLLGGNRWHDFAQAGLVEERRAGRLAYADAMFATAPSPACTTGF